MPGRVAGKVAFITGAGRGQGRSHATRLELAEHHIRVNSIHQRGVRTPMADGLHQQLTKILEGQRYVGPMRVNAMPDVEAVEAVDISYAVLFLASDESRYVTGLEMPVDAGNTIRL